MFRWWKDDITVYHRIRNNESGRTVTSWISEHCKNCYFSVKAQQRMVDNILEERTVRFVRIPKLNLPLQKGDIVVNDTVNDEITSTSGKEILEEYAEAFVVDTVKDNRGVNKELKHVYGSE